MEKERLDRLLTHLRMLKMDNDFDLHKERECFSCFYDLHLSAVGCKCSPDRYSCLRHSYLLCSCGMDERFVLFRYTMNELSTLVEALEGESHAIEVWENRNSGMVSANAEDAYMYKPDVERDMWKTKSHEESKSSPCHAGTNEKSNSNVLSSPYSQVSSELVHSESLRKMFCALYGTIDCDKKLVTDNEVMVEQAGPMDLNVDVTSGERENYLLHIADNRDNKGVPHVEKVCYSEARKERDNMELGAGCILSDSVAVLEKGFSPCSRDHQNSCSLDGCKLFGVDLQMNSESGEQLNSVCKTGVADTSNTCISLTNPSFLMQEFGTSVDLVSLGSVLHGKRWCNKHAIYPKGMLRYEILWD